MRRPVRATLTKSLLWLLLVIGLTASCQTKSANNSQGQTQGAATATSLADRYIQNLGTELQVNRFDQAQVTQIKEGATAAVTGANLLDSTYDDLVAPKVLQGAISALDHTLFSQKQKIFAINVLAHAMSNSFATADALNLSTKVGANVSGIQAALSPDNQDYLGLVEQVASTTVANMGTTGLTGVEGLTAGMRGVMAQLAMDLATQGIVVTQKPRALSLLAAAGAKVHLASGLIRANSGEALGAITAGLIDGLSLTRTAATDVTGPLEDIIQGAFEGLPATAGSPFFFS